MNEIKEGDVVVFKMTVIKIINAVATCGWFDTLNNYHEERFPVTMITKNGVSQV